MPRFLAKIEPALDGCWNWNSSIDADGYGQFYFQKKTWRAHRASWMLFKGEDPENLLVCHRCDNPFCVNPGHLFLGTCLDNIEDRVQKGRTASGDRNGMRTHPERVSRKPGVANPAAKLTDEQVRAIRLDKRTRTVVAAEYGVSRATIQWIVSGAHWKHVQ